ncbi:hypothetical protein AM2_076 [Lactococcus phage AM2]|uniref:Uncharacterized protein n=7 Tax=Audreyjarvisvirus AM1 TaxID=2845188 RepID=A0A1W6JLJ7_9CAUD|nr:hypothetical protein H1Z30_gp077 [Lactococcus phage AM1]ARM66381.1 hypothetical protein AM2_076 [Lactococcus phage AM2]ARM66558.1 hypothetical protein AM3_076 [Lactococcus phage AM3]ARM67111.1 hypothetical protein AM8_076 [Lactococcus phage AM8]ARM67290.1 hypothetical protein AM9_077 [Lactococcus phage AM9]ARM67468.1 hypothetical protein AM11_076 [Lactococcus phage AM11]ARQ95656.1 hypothetical protein AM12_077 [Lactococcus phage AM12]
MENERIQQLAELYECQMDVVLSENDKEELFQIYLEYQKESAKTKSSRMIHLARSSGNTNLLRHFGIFEMFEYMEAKNGK